MIWFEITTSDNEKHIINANCIMDMCYNGETNLTIIQVTRSAMPALYVRGNIMKEFVKAISNAMGSRLIRLGE